MNHCMVDLETLGNKPGCSIMSIGAVMFDEVSGELGDAFYVTVNRASCKSFGLKEDADTLEWWSKQSKDAQMILQEVSVSGVSLHTALALFTDYLTGTQYHHWMYSDDMSEPKSKMMDRLTIWGNGADFDNAILQVAYSAAGWREPPWKFWHNRCYRTLKSLHPSIKLKREGTHHNALDDARTQARHAIDLLRAQKQLAPVSTRSKLSQWLRGTPIAKSVIKFLHKNYIWI